MRIGIVRTAGSPCRCAESISAGLQVLGYEVILADSGEIEVYAQSLAHRCDLVFDHTDTFCGRGMYRSFVRLLLENCGARVVGSPAHACFVADNKPAAKKLLADTGIPVPPGIVIYSNTWKLPSWLRPPLIMKPAFEHMSRGVSLITSEKEAYTAAAALFEAMRQPILVESFIPGRELAVSLIGNSDAIQILPVLEWQTGTDILTEDFKVMDPAGDDHRAVRARLNPDLNRELEEFARQAFRILGLRDYARFDLRLSPQGNLFFLEANTTPSFEPLEALAVSAKWSGLDYPDFVARLLSVAHSRHSASNSGRAETLRISLPCGPVALQIPQEITPPPESTMEMARLLDVRQNEKVLELGCGSGLLSITAAMLGAERVTSTDLDPGALQTTMDNAIQNGVGGRIEIRAGSWYEALHDASRLSAPENCFDVIIATPPQTPGIHPFGPKYGGPDGIHHLARIIQKAPGFLNPGQGRLWLLAISLANPRAIWKMLCEHFEEVALVHKTKRPFTPDEYERLEKGLFDHLCRLRFSGICDFAEESGNRYYFHNLFIRASKPKGL